MTVEIRHMAPGDAAWLVRQHGDLYARDEGFDETFAPLVARILAAFEADHDPSCERAFIAWEEGRRLGSVFCVRLDDSTAQLRLFLLVPEARGKGLGRRLLSEWVGFAKAAGYARGQLWTHESHAAACALYARTGWTLVQSEPVQDHGRALVKQTWSLDLSRAS